MATIRPDGRPEAPELPAPPAPPPPAPPPMGVNITELMSGGFVPPSQPGNQGVADLPADLVGDIPPPPVPVPALPPSPSSIIGPGVAGIRGTEAGTFARPGTRGTLAYHTPRFGPGMPSAGGMVPEGLGMTPDEAGDLLRRLASGG